MRWREAVVAPVPGPRRGLLRLEYEWRACATLRDEAIIAPCASIHRPQGQRAAVVAQRFAGGRQQCTGSLRAAVCIVTDDADAMTGNGGHRVPPQRRRRETPRSAIDDLYPVVRAVLYQCGVSGLATVKLACREMFSAQTVVVAQVAVLGEMTALVSAVAYQGLEQPACQSVPGL